MNHRDEDGHIRSRAVCLFGKDSKLHTTHVFFIYSSKQQCLVKTRCFGGGWGHGWMSVYGMTGRSGQEKGSERGIAGGKKWGQGWSLFLYERLSLGPFAALFFLAGPLLQLSPQAFASLLLRSLCYSLLSSLPALWPGSCVALAHAGSQHQSTLLRDFWVFNHALPQPLFLPI